MVWRGLVQRSCADQPSDCGGTRTHRETKWRSCLRWRQGERSPESAIALLRLLNDTLQAMISLVFVRIFPLPATGGAGIKGKHTGIGRAASPCGAGDVTRGMA